MIRTLTSHPNHGKVVWRYNELHKQLSDPSFFTRASRISSMFLQPISHIIFWTVYICFPDIHASFGGTYDHGTTQLIFYVISSIQVLISCILRWSETIEHYTLGTTLMVWKILTVGLRVPPLDIHSASVQDHMFQYAAGALLLQNISDIPTEHPLK